MLAEKTGAIVKDARRIVHVMGEDRFTPGRFKNPESPIPFIYLSDSFKRLLFIGEVIGYTTRDFVVDISRESSGSHRASELHEAISLGHIYGLFARLQHETAEAKKEQVELPDFLRMDGGSTFCFVRDRRTKPWLVRIYSDGTGWGLGAEEAERDIPLHAGSHFLMTVPAAV